MPEFIEVARVEQIPPGTGITVKVAGNEVAIFNVDGDRVCDRRLMSTRRRVSWRGQAERHHCHLSCARLAL